MSKKVLISLLILILLGSSFTSCKKKQEKRLTGDWKEVEATIDYHRFFWEFFDDGTFIRREVRLEYGGFAYDTGLYVLQYKFPNFYLTVSNLRDDNNTNGKYKIEDLDKKFLRMTRVEVLDTEYPSSPWVYKEFIKN